MSVPETRASLLLRLRDFDDHAAWESFIDLYRDVIRAMAVRRGMQSADADDLTQTVMIAVARSIDRFEIDSGRAKFRTWLSRIAANAIINATTRRPRDRAAGGDADAFLRELGDDPDTQTVCLEYRRAVFDAAAGRVKQEVAPETFEAFWRTVVCGEPIETVANSMGRRPGSVYTARSRVMAKIRHWVEQLDVDRRNDSKPDDSKIDVAGTPAEGSP